MPGSAGSRGCRRSGTDADRCGYPRTPARRCPPACARRRWRRPTDRVCTARDSPRAPFPRCARPNNSIETLRAAWACSCPHWRSSAMPKTRGCSVPLPAHGAARLLGLLRNASTSDAPAPATEKSWPRRSAPARRRRRTGLARARRTAGPEACTGVVLHKACQRIECPASHPGHPEVRADLGGRWCRGVLCLARPGPHGVHMGSRRESACCKRSFGDNLIGHRERAKRRVR